MDDAGTFGPYRLGELLGRGGMGTVHRAFDTRRVRDVALKRLDERLSGETGYRERFRRECRLAARLSSPHVVPIHDFGEIDGVLYLDMRLIEGRGLDRVLDDGALPPDRALRTVEQIAHALDAAHAAGLVHRDVKPSNVLVGEPDGFVHLADFGIARSLGIGSGDRLTGTGEVLGSLAYLAPESFAGGPPDRRADVYALACVLYETLTGRRPFDGDAAQLVFHHLHTPPPDPRTVRAGLPPAVTDVVRRGMAKDPALRPGSAGELARTARAALGAGPPAASGAGGRPGGAALPATVVGGPVPFAAGPRGPRSDEAAPPGGSRRGLVVAAVVAAVVLVAGAAGLAALGLPDRATSTPAAPSPAAPNSATPSSGPVTAPDTTALRLAFPDTGRVGCAPSSPPATSAGRGADAAITCDLPATRVRFEFLQWATPADGALFVDDAGDRRTSYESVWKIANEPQGPVFFGEDPAGGWVAVGVYRDRRYGFRARGPDRAQLTAAFPDMRFVTADRLPP